MNHHITSPEPLRSYTAAHDALRDKVLSAAHWVALDIAANGQPSAQASQALLAAENALEADLGLTAPDLISTTIGPAPKEGSNS